MKHPLPTRQLPERPNLDQLKRQAKELLETRAADPGYALHDAQFELARSYGFDSWPKLKAFVDGVDIQHLTEAVRIGEIDRVRAMLKVRPELAGMVEAWNNEHTALHYAVLGRMPEMVRLLMEYGADARAGISPHNDATGSLTMARDRGYDEIVDIILEEEGRRDTGPAEWLPDHGAVSQTDADSSAAVDAAGPVVRAESAARAAVIAGDEAFLRARHVEGALADPKDDRGWLLQVAVEHDRPDMLKLLLDLGLDPDARARVEGVDEVSFTWGMPLYHCARNSKHAMAQVLLERGADPNAQVYASGTPLSEAYGQRDEAMIALLERYGGRSNAAIAGMYRRVDLARKLLADESAESMPSDGFGSGPIAAQLAGAAARGGDPEILQMAIDRLDIPRGDPRWVGLLAGPLEMWNHGPWPWAHHEWDRGDYVTCFRMILERCGDLNVHHRFGTTILHELVASHDHVRPEERVAFATLMLDAGARLDLRDDLLKSTPFGWAARWGRVELVRLFLSRGADPDEPNAEPWATPRAWARRMGREDVLAAMADYR